jgi:acetylglutamate kinase
VRRIIKQIISVNDMAEILVQALPYIQKYAGKIVVIKYGGGAMLNPVLKRAVMNDVVLLSQVGVRVVLVHGGGPEITALLDRLGMESAFVDGLRVTDEAASEVVQMVLAGKINKDLAAMANEMGGKAIGLCGMDAGMIKAQKVHGAVDLGFVGDVCDVNIAPITLALEHGYIPIIATVGIDDSNHVMNINADTASAAIAAALGAENVIMMTDIRGLMRDMNDPSSLISSIDVSDVPQLIEEGVVTGGMIPKVNCLAEAVRQGVTRAVMIDGRIPHAILIEMFSDQGIGTLFQGG